MPKRNTGGDLNLKGENFKFIFKILKNVNISDERTWGWTFKKLLIYPSAKVILPFLSYRLLIFPSLSISVALSSNFLHLPFTCLHVHLSSYVSLSLIHISRILSSLSLTLSLLISPSLSPLYYSLPICLFSLTISLMLASSQLIIRLSFLNISS